MAYNLRFLNKRLTVYPLVGFDIEVITGDLDADERPTEGPYFYVTKNFAVGGNFGAGVSYDLGRVRFFTEASYKYTTEKAFNSMMFYVGAAYTIKYKKSVKYRIW